MFAAITHLAMQPVPHEYDGIITAAALILLVTAGAALAFTLPAVRAERAAVKRELEFVRSEKVSLREQRDAFTRIMCIWMDQLEANQAEAPPSWATIHSIAGISNFCKGPSPGVDSPAEPAIVDFEAVDCCDNPDCDCDSPPKS